MKPIGWLFAACIAMALLKLAITALAIALLLLLVWGAVNRPREALALITFACLAGNPVLLFVLVTSVLTACLIGKAIERC